MPQHIPKLLCHGERDVDNRQVEGEAEGMGREIRSSIDVRGAQRALVFEVAHEAGHVNRCSSQGRRDMQQASERARPSGDVRISVCDIELPDGTWTGQPGSNVELQRINGKRRERTGSTGTNHSHEITKC